MPGSYRHFTPWEKGDRHCEDKVNLDDVTKPERCPSFRLSSAPSQELCYPLLCTGVSTKAPCNWKPAIPARDQRSLRHPSLHPSAPVWSPSDTASRCPPARMRRSIPLLYPSQGFAPGKEKHSLLVFAKNGDGKKRQPSNTSLRAGILSF